MRRRGERLGAIAAETAQPWDEFFGLRAGGGFGGLRALRVGAGSFAGAAIGSDLFATVGRFGGLRALRVGAGSFASAAVGGERFATGTRFGGESLAFA